MFIPETKLPPHEGGMGIMGVGLKEEVIHLHPFGFVGQLKVYQARADANLLV